MAEPEGFPTWWQYAYDVAHRELGVSDEAILAYDWRAAYGRRLSAQQAAEDAKQKDEDQ